MFSGIQEILVIVLVISGIFLIPRMMKPRPAPQKVVLRRAPLELSWTLRLAIILSILWPLACAFYFKPWHLTAQAGDRGHIKSTLEVVTC